MKDWIIQLSKSKIGTIIEGEPMSKHTTWKIGGPADAFIKPYSKEKLIQTIQILNNHHIPWKVLGKGSNLLVLDKGFRGALISLDEEEFKNIQFAGNSIQVGASFSLIRLANLAAKSGLTGLEFAGGIPGTVGGAIFMNAGAHGSDISRILQEAEVILENGEIVTWNKEQLNFSYRNSILQKEKGIIVSALFKLEPGDRKKIAEDMASFKNRRRMTQPYHLPCSGSIFRNPEGDYAGRLIEQLGLKGYQIGGAMISTMHANFIVNTNEAKATDVIDLIEYIKEVVLVHYGIPLKPEVEIIGEG